MLTAVLAALVYFDPENIKSGVLLGSLTLASILTKTSGMLTIPIVGLSLVAMYPSLKDLKKIGVLACFGTLAVSGLVLVSNNLFHFSRISSEPIKNFFGAIVFSGSPAFYIENAPFIYSTPVFLLSILGTYIALTGKKEFRAVAVVFLSYFFFFSFMVGEKVPRYALPTIPLVILLATFAVSWALKKFELPNYAILGMVALAYFAYQPAPDLLHQRSMTYTGFQELGEKVAEFDQLQDFDTVYAQSERQMRAFSGIDYAADGGKIKRLPANLSELSDQSNILIQLDVWEYTGPDWTYPLDQEKLDAISAANFTPVHIVQRDYPTQQGTQKVPVGFLLAKG
jgi:hypothetical protein